MQFSKNGRYDINFSATDNCGNETRGVRQVVIVQNLREGDYIKITEQGTTATISADLTEGYYNKDEINAFLADLDTVKFKKVAVLPPFGAMNVIYLVAKEAPDEGYWMYIWNEVTSDFEPIGDTNIDLSDYYTKTESDTRYYQKSDVYTKTESDNRYYNKTESDTRYYQKSQVYNKSESDELFQDKLSNGADLTAADGTYLSYVDLSAKKTSKLKLSDLWGYIKGKFTGDSLSSVTDSTRVSGIDTSQSDVHKYFTAGMFWNYIKDKFTKETINTVQDSTLMGTVNVDSADPVKQFTASTLWTYIIGKSTKTVSNTATDTQIPSNKAVYTYVEARRRYLHTLVRYNNDAKEYPMGWLTLITDNATETYATIAKWLYDNNHRTPQTSYYWVGGCCGTTGVRNSADTGTAYIGRVTSGAFSEDGTSITYKYDYNGTVSVNDVRTTVYSEPLMKL